MRIIDEIIVRHRNRANGGDPSAPTHGPLLPNIQPLSVGRLDLAEYFAQGHSVYHVDKFIACSFSDTSPKRRKRRDGSYSETPHRHCYLWPNVCRTHFHGTYVCVFQWQRKGGPIFRLSIYKDEASVPPKYRKTKAKTNHMSGEDCVSLSLSRTGESRHYWRMPVTPQKEGLLPVLVDPENYWFRIPFPNEVITTNNDEVTGDQLEIELKIGGVLWGGTLEKR